MNIESFLSLLPTFDPTHWVLLVTMLIAAIAWYRSSSACDKSQNELKELNEAHSKTLQDLNERTVQLHALQKTFDQQSKNYESLKTTADENARSNAVYQQAWAELRKQQKIYQTDLGVLNEKKNEILRREKELGKTEETIGSLRSSVSVLNYDLSEMLDRLNKTKAELQAAKATIESRNADIDRLKHLGRSESRYRKQRFILKCAVGALLCRLQFRKETDRQEAQEFVFEKQKEFRKLVNETPELMAEMQMISNDFIALSRMLSEKAKQ